MESPDILFSKTLCHQTYDHIAQETSSSTPLCRRELHRVRVHLQIVHSFVSSELGHGADCCAETASADDAADKGTEDEAVCWVNFFDDEDDCDHEAEQCPESSETVINYKDSPFLMCCFLYIRDPVCRIPEDEVCYCF